MMITQMERIKRLLGQEETIHWDRVFTTELPRILNYFRFHGLEDAAAEDLTAATLEKAWRGRDSYRRDKSTVCTWLYAIAHHALIDYFRSNTDELPLDRLIDRPEGLVDPSLEEAAQRADDRERLRRILLDLPERERELVALKYGAEMTNRAIARQTGLSETNVGTILNRVITSMRRQMEDIK